VVAPTSTYRVQVRPGFGFDEVAGVADHLAALGVTHVYLSPVLEATPGSAHGYDVVDHDLVSTQAGGRTGFEAMASALGARGLSVVVDVVPNHMAVPTPVRLNHALWSVLRDGPASPYADWFDVDWSVPDRAILMPVLGERIGTALVRGEITLDSSGEEPVLRYFAHEFPVRPGTEDLPLEVLVDRQWYRLAWWRVADEELNYRRFFDVDTLAAVRVEDPEVFRATHHVLLELVAEGTLTGLRIDHPDGLADPRGYLARLADATDGTWVVVEKILEGDETLPADWACAGTTGYDALLRVGGLFVDAAGAAPLDRLLVEQTGETAAFEDVVEQAKREIVAQSLYAEVHRLTDLVFETCHADIALRDHPRRHLHAALVELLVAFERYRAYVVPGEPAPAESVAVVEEAAERARERLPEEAREALDVVVDLVLARPAGTLAFDEREAARRVELAVRFQQTCGPVMAKGVEDTAFYRWHRLAALNEVGGEPTHFGVPPEEFHAFAGRLQRDWPATMTTLSTHDTKRSEDVRARLAGISELTDEWAEAVRTWTEHAGRFRSSDGHPEPATTYLVWQTLVGTWDRGPIPFHRLGPYLEKATREAKRFTWWTRPDAAYDDAVQAYARAVLEDEPLLADVARFAALLEPVSRVNVLGQKLVQLTMPGVPDVYQGCETVDLSLVDPDNRRDVDFDDRRDRLARLDAGEKPQDLSDEKLLVTSRALRTRRDHPGWFAGPGSGYAPVATTTGNALAFTRGPVVENGADSPTVLAPSAVTVVTRLPAALERHGGWGDHAIYVPDGAWRDVLSGARVHGGGCRVADLLEHLPVALLVREG